MRGRDRWAEDAEAIAQAQQKRDAERETEAMALRALDAEEYRKIVRKESRLSANERRAVVRRMEARGLA